MDVDASTCQVCKRTFKDLLHHLSCHPSCRSSYACSQGDALTASPDPAMVGDAVASRTAIYERGMTADVVDELGSLRHEAQVSGNTVDGFKRKLQGWLESAEASLIDELEPHVSSASGINVAELIQSRLGWLRGIETSKLEEAAHRKLLGAAWVTPVKRELGEHEEQTKDADGEVIKTKTIKDAAWDIPLIAQLQALIAHDSDFWTHVKASSSSWSREEPPDEPDVIADICDGQLFIEHPKLGRKSGPIPCPTTPGGQRIKLGFKGYYDEVECVNALGGAAGTHEIGCTYVSCLNLPAELRNKLEYTFVVTLCLKNAMKHHGAIKIIGGAKCDTDGTYTPLEDQSTSLGGQLRLLDQGTCLRAPGVCATDGYQRTIFCGWMVLFCADFPAAGAVTPYAQSVSASKCCRECEWETFSKEAYKPTSFIAGTPRWRLRSEAGQAAQIERVRATAGKGRRNKLMKEFGLYKLNYTLHPSLFPYMNAAEGLPQDVMHAEFSSGTCNYEAAEMLYLFIAREKWFTVDQLNERIRAVDIPDAQRPPYIYESVAIGQKGGLPKDGAHLRYSGSQTMYFTIHSINILQPLIQDEKHPAWLSWLVITEGQAPRC